MNPDDLWLDQFRDGWDVIAVRRSFIDMAGNIEAGVLLSQIVYWFTLDRNREARTDVERDGVRWIIRRREDWWDECRLRPGAFDYAFKALAKSGLVRKAVFRHNGSPTMHITLDVGEVRRRHEDLISRSQQTMRTNSSNADIHVLSKSRDPNPGNAENILIDKTAGKTIKIPDAANASPNGQLPAFDTLSADVLALAAATVAKRKPAPKEGSAAWRDMVRVEAARLMG